MSRYPNTDTSFQAGDWLAGAARRNPEALLLLAAGACLLMRGRGSSSSRSPASPARPTAAGDAGWPGPGRTAASSPTDDSP
jgi:organic hydroperoxide reductase OsmC/OhrA